MNKDEALKMAIEALMAGSKIADMFMPNGDRTIQFSKAINACKEALEQPAQEVECSNHPDAPHGFCRDASHSAGRYVCECEGWEVEQPAQEPVKLIRNENENYSPKHQWQGLTDDEIENARYNWERHNDYKHNREIQLLLVDFARAIEAKLKEKNT
jgi:hypothetical protein